MLDEQAYAACFQELTCRAMSGFFCRKDARLRLDSRSHTEQRLAFSPRERLADAFAVGRSQDALFGDDAGDQFGGGHVES